MVNLPQVALQHIVERPKHLDKMHGQRGSKYVKIAETLKVMERTKALAYDEAEFEREFGKFGKNSMKAALKKNGIKKPRLVVDDGKVYIWSNDEK